VKRKSLVSKSLPFEKNFLSSDIRSSSMEDKGFQILDSEVMTGKKDTETIVILSDDEVEPKKFPIPFYQLARQIRTYLMAT
jgi:senataxin